MSQCWAQEPDQRPTFHNIQDQLQLFRNFSLNNTSRCGEEAHASGVINKGFEGKLDSSEFFPSVTERDHNGMHTESTVG